MKKHIILILVLGLVCSCKGFLEPLPNGSYNEDNYDEYPKIIRGYVEKAYDLLPAGYISTDYLGGDGLSDCRTTCHGGPIQTLFTSLLQDLHRCRTTASRQFIPVTTRVYTIATFS